MNRTIINYDIELLAESQYLLGGELTRKKRFSNHNNVNQAITAFAQAFWLYKKSSNSLMANLCRTNISGLAIQYSLDRNLQEMYLNAHRQVQNTIDVIEEINNSLNELSK